MRRLYAGCTRQIVLPGAAYGLLPYLLMNFAVLPLSAADLPKFDNLARVASGTVMHMPLGVLIAWFAKKALGR